MKTARRALWTRNRTLGALALIGALLPIRPAAALVSLTDGPAQFDVRFVCSSAVPGSCPDAEADARLVAGFFETAWNAYEDMGLPLPERRLPVNLRHLRADCDCFTQEGCAVGVPGRNYSSKIRINMHNLLFCSDTTLANTSAHELAHSVQYEYVAEYLPAALARVLINGVLNLAEVAANTLENQNVYEYWNWWEGWPSAMAMLVNTDDSANPPFQADDWFSERYRDRYQLWAFPIIADGDDPYPHEYVLPWRLQSETIPNSELKTIKRSGYHTGAFWMYLAQRIGTPPLSASTGIEAGQIFPSMMETISTEIADETLVGNVGADIMVGLDTFIDDEIGMTRLEFLQDMSFAWAVERFGDPRPAGPRSPGLAVQRRSDTLDLDRANCDLDEKDEEEIDAPSWLVRHDDVAPPGPEGAPVEYQVGGEFVDGRTADDLLTGRTQFWSFDSRTRARQDYPLRPTDDPATETPVNLLNVPPFAVSVRTAPDTPSEWQARALGGHRCDDEEWITPILAVDGTLQAVPNDLRFTDFAFLMNSRRNGRDPSGTPAAPGGPSPEVYEQVWGGASEASGSLELRYDFAPEDAWLPLNGTRWSAPGSGRWTTLSVDAAEASGPVAYIKGLSHVSKGQESAGKAGGLPNATANPRAESTNSATIEAVLENDEEKAKYTAEENSFEDALGSKGGKRLPTDGIEAVGFGEIGPETVTVTVMVTDDDVQLSDVEPSLSETLARPWVFAELLDPSDADPERLPQPFDIVGRVERVEPGENSRRREWETLNPVPYEIDTDVDGRLPTASFDQYGLDTRMAVLDLPLDGRGEFSEVSAHRLDILPAQRGDGRGGETYFVTGYAGNLIEEQLPELIVQDTWVNFTEWSCGAAGESDSATAVVTAWVTNQGSELASKVCVDFDFSGVIGRSPGTPPVVTACPENFGANLRLYPGQTLGINATVEVSFTDATWVAGQVHTSTPDEEAIEINNRDAFAGSIGCPFGKAPAQTFKHDEIFSWAEDQEDYRKLIEKLNQIAELEAATFMQELLQWLTGPDVEPPVHQYFSPDYPRFHGLVQALEPLVAAGFTKPEIGRRLGKLGLTSGELRAASGDQLRVLADAALEDARYQQRITDQYARPKASDGVLRLTMPGGVLTIGPKGGIQVHAPSQGYAVVDLEGFDSGDVWFDGRSSGYDAAEIPFLVVPPGVHEIVVTGPGRLDEIASICARLEPDQKTSLTPRMHCDLDANTSQKQLRAQLEVVETVESLLEKGAPDAFVAALEAETTLDSIQEEFQSDFESCAPDCAIGSFALSRRLEDAIQTARKLRNARAR